MKPLWKILGWKLSDFGWVMIPDTNGFHSKPTHLADEYVTSDHLLDWLDENTIAHGGWREEWWDDLKSRKYFHYADIKGFSFETAHVDRRTCIGLCLREVYSHLNIPGINDESPN